MNRKRVRQMNAALLRRLITRPAALWMEGRHPWPHHFNRSFRPAAGRAVNKAAPPDGQDRAGPKGEKVTPSRLHYSKMEVILKA